jgi:hypothetical protein
MEFPHDPEERQRIKEEAVRFYEKYPDSIYSAELLSESAGFVYGLRWMSENNREQADMLFKHYWELMVTYIRHPYAKKKEGAITTLHEFAQQHIERFGALPEGLPEIPE